MKTLTIITGSEKKISEMLHILNEKIPFQICHQKIDLPEYQGNLEFIIQKKCQRAVKIIDGPVLVEDTSLSISCLSGLPGPYIKWFVDSIGPDGIYRMIKDWPDKNATAICMIAFTESIGKPIKIFKGCIEGKIVQPKGNNNFGWDSCFQPDGYDESFAEMDVSIKNQISHRYKCLTELKNFLENK